MARLSVAQLLPALNSGGVERGTLEVARELVRCGHRSVVISTRGRLVPELLRDGSEHLDWPLGVKLPLTLRWVRPLRRWLTEQRIDILHARSRSPTWIGWLVAFEYASSPSDSTVESVSVTQSRPVTPRS